MAVIFMTSDVPSFLPFMHLWILPSALMRWSIVHVFIKRALVIISKLFIFLSLNIVYVLANGEYPDEMSHDV